MYILYIDTYTGAVYIYNMVAQRAGDTTKNDIKIIPPLPPPPPPN